MSKRGKDLFYLLEQREQDVRSEAPAARGRGAAGSRSAGAAGRSSSAVGAVRQWFGGGRPAKQGANNPAAQVPPGLILAVVALIALGGGFALGRFLPHGQAVPELAARGEGAAPRRPGPVKGSTVKGAPVDGATVDGATVDGATVDGATVDGSGEDRAKQPGNPIPVQAPGDLSPDREEEILSNLWFQLLQFDASQRAAAAQAATFLRASGVDTVRIRGFKTVSKSDVWVVVAYATSREAAAGLLAKLQAVPATRTWPTLRRDIAKLTVKDHLMTLTGK